MTDCIRKLGELIVKFLGGLVELAKKLGINISKIGKMLGGLDISKIFKVPDFGKIAEFFKDLSFSSLNPLDFFKKIPGLLTDAGGYIKERVVDIIDSFKNFSIDISIFKLLKKLGMSLEDLARKLGMTLEDLFESITNIKISSLHLKWPDLGFGDIDFNIMAFLKKHGMSIVEFFKDFGNIDLKKFSLADLARKLGRSIADIVAAIGKGVGDIDFLNILETIVTGPFRITGKILSEINDQINKYLCNGRLIRNLGRMLGDMEDAVKGLLKKLSPTDLKKLFGDANFGKLFENFAIGTIAVDSILNNIKDFGTGRLWINPPTELTINNDEVPTAIKTDLSDLEGILVDEDANKPITNSSNQGGPWDIDDTGPSTFSLNSPFKIEGDDMEVITQEELKSKLYIHYDDIYSNIDFDIQSDIKEITPVRDVIKTADIGDYIFNLGITGNTSYTIENLFYRSEITLVYGISKRFNIYDDIDKDCVVGSTTRMILSDSISFFGLGESLDNSRYNAFLEARNKATTAVTDNINTIISTNFEA